MEGETEKMMDSVSEAEKERKTPINIILFFSARITYPYLTAHTMESIICSLQRYLILTTAAKKFHEK